MKFGIIIGVLIGIVILGATVTSVLILAVLPVTRTLSSEGGTGQATYTTIPSTIPSSRLPAGTTASSSADVRFSPEITDISGENLSRTITAKLTNSGTSDAHNVRARVEVFSLANRIKIKTDGIEREYLEKKLGTIKAGTTVTVRETVSISVFDSWKISRDGAVVSLTIYSDEATRTTSYEYKP